MGRDDGYEDDLLDHGMMDEELSDAQANARRGAQRPVVGEDVDEAQFGSYRPRSETLRRVLEDDDSLPPSYSVPPRDRRAARERRRRASNNPISILLNDMNPVTRTLVLGAGCVLLALAVGACIAACLLLNVFRPA
jgi:hypothetical protein